MNNILGRGLNTKQISKMFLNVFNATIIQQTLFTNVGIFVSVRVAMIGTLKIIPTNIYVLVATKSPHPISNCFSHEHLFRLIAKLCRNI